MIDLRSDTVTRPTGAMRKAMAAADVGDDVFGDDPTVNALQYRLCELTGKPAALFLPSGTQSNLVGVLSHCGRGDELLIGAGYHVVRHEAGGAAVLGGVLPTVLPVDERGAVAPASITAAVRPDDPHFPITRLLCLENTVTGIVQPLEAIGSCVATARAHGLRVHLDGARLWNAVVATGVDLATWCALADTVSLCLSKGLGAPVGSVLVGDEASIARAHRLRKLVGGGMRQAGVLAAAGLHALDHHVERLAEDHARAESLARAVTELDRPDVRLVRQDTNMVYLDLDHPEQLEAHLAASGVLVSAGPTTRLVTHLDVDDAGLATIIGALETLPA